MVPNIVSCGANTNIAGCCIDDANNVGLCSLPCERTDSSTLKLLVTIVVEGVDVGIAYSVNLKHFIEEECIARLCLVENGGALTHKHFQMVVKGNFSRLPMLNKKIKMCMGWDSSTPTGHVLLCKKLRDEGLHMFKSIAWLMHEG